MKYLKIFITKDNITDVWQKILSFNNFTIDGKQIEGVRTITRDTVTDLTGRTYNISMVNGKIIYTDATFCTRSNETKIRVWVNGFNNPTYMWYTYEYNITGNDIRYG